jgi:hypothetical protein
MRQIVSDARVAVVEVRFDIARVLGAHVKA